MHNHTKFQIAEEQQGLIVRGSVDSRSRNVVFFAMAMGFKTKLLLLEKCVKAIDGVTRDSRVSHHHKCTQTSLTASLVSVSLSSSV